MQQSLPPCRSHLPNAFEWTGQGRYFRRRSACQADEVLKDKAQFFTAEFVQCLAFERGDVCVFKVDMPCGHTVNGGNAVEQSGLSAARCAHDGKKFALCHREGNIINGFRQARFVSRSIFQFAVCSVIPFQTAPFCILSYSIFLFCRCFNLTEHYNFVMLAYCTSCISFLPNVMIISVNSPCTDFAETP